MTVFHFIAYWSSRVSILALIIFIGVFAQLGEYDHFIVFGPLAKTVTSEDGDML